MHHRRPFAAEQLRRPDPLVPGAQAIIPLHRFENLPCGYEFLGVRQHFGTGGYWPVVVFAEIISDCWYAEPGAKVRCDEFVDRFLSGTSGFDQYPGAVARNGPSFRKVAAGGCVGRVEAEPVGGGTGSQEGSSKFLVKRVGEEVHGIPFEVG